MTIADNLLAATYSEANDIANTGWHFYRNYFEPNSGSMQAKNDKLERQPLRRIPEMENGFANTVFQLKTTYPGLLIGTGYLHEKKEENDAIKIGFYFDHATGMPVVPGSSVKGALRGAFPQFSDDEASVDFDENRVAKLTHLKQDKRDEIKAALPLKKERALFVHCLLFLVEEEREALSLEELKAIHAFERETFESQKDWKQGKEKGDNFHGIYRRDLFFDAVPVAILQPNNGGRKQLFGMDYITPHKHTPKRPGETKRPELDPFSDPIPLKFLKVMPEVVYEFRFRLQPSNAWPDGLVNGQKKENFFKNLLLLLGVGAKTNVGYGHFSDDLNIKNNKSPYEGTEPGKGTSVPNPYEKKQEQWQEFIAPNAREVLKANESFEGKIVEIDERGYCILHFEANGAVSEIRKKFSSIKIGKEKVKELSQVKVNDLVIIKVIRDFVITDPFNCQVQLKV